MNNYEKGFYHSLIFLIGGFTALSFVYLCSIELVKEILIAFIPAVASLFAVIFGAKLAFKYQLDKEEIKTTQFQKAKAEVANLKISAMINHVIVYDSQMILPELKWKEMKFIAIKPADITHMRVNFDIYDIHFLFKGENVNLLGEISAAIDSYNSLLNNIEIRSHLHENIQRKIEASGIVAGNYADYKRVIGERECVSLSRLTDDLITTLDETVVKLYKSMGLINNQIKAKFKGADIYQVNLQKYIENKTKHNQSFNADSLKLTG